MNTDYKKIFEDLYENYSYFFDAALIIVLMAIVYIPV